MTTPLSDHDCEGQARRILYSLHKLGYAEWLEFEILFFYDLGLPFNAKDEEVWRFCQENSYLLLTGNRTRKDGDESLHVVLNRLATKDSLPVITVGNPNRVIKDKTYSDACAEAIARIILNIELYIGIPRLYIP